MPKASWARYGEWSGIRIRGVHPVKPGFPPTEWDVVMAAICAPESGMYDTIVSYDGTGMTAGMFQWTLTSGRLQKLLYSMLLYVPSLWHRFREDLAESGIVARQEQGDSILFLDAETQHEAKGKAAIRGLFTAPGGKVPRSGVGHDRAVAIAQTFYRLFSHKFSHWVQQRFAYEEMRREMSIGRPNLGGASAAEILGIFPRASIEIVPSSTQAIAAWAMYAAMWQNGPRAAEKVLLRASKSEYYVRFDLFRYFRNSRYANWGVSKCAKCAKCGWQNDDDAARCHHCRATLRTSRYTKVARAINGILGEVIK